MFSPSRAEARRFMVEAWRKRCQNLPATPMELLVSDVIAAHPEYHALFESGDDSLARDWSPEDGQTNPFLHIFLHVAVREQVQIDQPPGIRAAHAALSAWRGDALEAEHCIMECLAEQIWQNQRNGVPFDNARYLACIQQRQKGLSR